MMKKMKLEKAIKYFENEIRFCENAPALNGCEMTEDWMLTRDACKLAVAALKEQQERKTPEPLTMKELLGMLGEPVWVAPNHGGKGFWSIVSNSLLGVSDGFTAYRSKPEEKYRLIRPYIGEDVEEWERRVNDG